MSSTPQQLVHEDQNFDTSRTSSTYIEETCDDLSNETDGLDPTQFLHDNSFIGQYC